jgi:hypothetical protein
MPKTWNSQGENNCSKGQTGGKKELQAYNITPVLTALTMRGIWNVRV